MEKCSLWLSTLSLVLLACLGVVSWSPTTISRNNDWILTVAPASATELAATFDDKLCRDTDHKIDLNNDIITVFTECPGFYPTLA